MAGMSLGPTAGFWSKFKTAMPGALNAMAQNMGPDYMKPMARATGGLQKGAEPKAPVPTEKQMKGEKKSGGGNRIDMPNNIVRPYGGFNFGMNQLPIINSQPAPMQDMGNMGGLWSAYNRLAGLGGPMQSVPSRGLYY